MLAAVKSNFAEMQTLFYSVDAFDNSKYRMSFWVVVPYSMETLMKIIHLLLCYKENWSFSLSFSFKRNSKYLFNVLIFCRHFIIVINFLSLSVNYTINHGAQKPIIIPQYLWFITSWMLCRGPSYNFPLNSSYFSLPKYIGRSR